MAVSSDSWWCEPPFSAAAAASSALDLAVVMDSPFLQRPRSGSDAETVGRNAVSSTIAPAAHGIREQSTRPAEIDRAARSSDCGQRWSPSRASSRGVSLVAGPSASSAGSSSGTPVAARRRLRRVVGAVAAGHRHRVSPRRRRPPSADRCSACATARVGHPGPRPARPARLQRSICLRRWLGQVGPVSSPRSCAADATAALRSSRCRLQVAEQLASGDRRSRESSFSARLHGLGLKPLGVTRASDSTRSARVRASVVTWCAVRLASSRIRLASSVASSTSRSACSVDISTSRTTAELASLPVVTTMVLAGLRPAAAGRRAATVERPGCRTLRWRSGLRAPRPAS